jgi:hypothetical protein
MRHSLVNKPPEATPVGGNWNRFLKQFDAAAELWYQLNMTTMGKSRHDLCWRKSRVAARILLREQTGTLTPRDIALGKKLAADPGVTPRLIDQALYGFSGKPYRVAVARRQNA